SFLALGSFEGVTAYEVTKDPDAWPETVFICDPWANVACRARDYKTAWLQKMHQWSRNSKAIGFENKWISPLKEDWALSIERANRVVDLELPEGFPASYKEEVLSHFVVQKT